MIWAFIDKFYQAVIITLTAFLLLALIGLGIQSWRITDYKASYKDIKQKYELDVAKSNEAVAKAKADAAIKEKSWAEQITKAEQNYNAKIQEINTDANSARASADSLSKQLDKARSRLPTATRETIIEYINTNSDILESCITEYRAMAQHADEHAADEKRLIDAWPEDKAL